MKLHVGERLPGAGPPSYPGGYVVTGVAAETPWYALYTAKKIFYNFDFTGKRPRETDDKEWLDVYLRTINYPRLDDPTYVAQRRALARAELKRILSNRTSNLWPEPLDLLEVPNTRDPFLFPRAPSPSETEGSGAAGESSRVPPPPLDPQMSLLVGTEPIIAFARPQGEPLARWQQNVQPLSWVLSVLAELLEFIRSAHADGLLLNGLGPGAVTIDPVGRVHYLATDMVVEMPSGTKGDPANESPSAGMDWARFFPPERYPRGFSPPECFDPALPRDRRTDLYSWAAIAYFLLTGDRPAQLALDQGQPWAHFQEAQFVRLNRALRSIPPALVRIWAEQLGVGGDVLVRAWPRNFLTAMQHCLHADPRLRPASVPDFRAWLAAPPPAPIPAALALRIAPAARVKLWLDLREADPALTMVVRRGTGFQPLTATEGELVSDGPLRSPVEDMEWQMTGAAPEGESAPVIQYAIFTRSAHGGSISYSVATFADLIEGTPADILGYAEGGAPPGSTDELEPARIHLLFEAFDPVELAGILQASSLPQVRSWAIARIARGKKAAPAIAVLRRALQDPALAIRLEAARGLLEGASRPPVSLVRQVVEVVGAGNTDDSIQAARSLRQIGVTEEIIRETIAGLERDRPLFCPQCGMNLQDRDRLTHLMTVHGYVDVFGSLLPRPEAETRLWDRALSQFDPQAHERLCELLDLQAQAVPTWPARANDENEAAEPAWPPYLVALEAELLRRADALLAARWQALPKLVKCLHQNKSARPYFRFLLTAEDLRLREIGRELVLPEVGDRLAGENVAAQTVRQELDSLCPPELLEEKIQLCIRLPHVGVDVAAAEACLRTLQEERVTPCPHCGSPVTVRDLAAHLRRAHWIYLFRGSRRSLPDTLAALLAAVCGSSPDYEAWQMLEGIAREEHPQDADAFLMAELGKTLLGLPAKRRDQAMSAAAEAIVSGGSGPRFAHALAETANPQKGSAPGKAKSEGQVTLGRLALELAIRLPVPLEPTLLQAVLSLLSVKEMPLETRLAAAAALLGTTGKDGKAAANVLQALIAETGKAKAIERLQELEQRVGNCPAIEALCTALEDQIRMICPRCAVELRRQAMRDHLWEEHRLVLDGRRVRQPWRVIEDWLEDYRLEKDAVILERCRELAQRLDAEHGLHRLHRLMLAHGIDDARASRAVLAEAQRLNQSLCPHCYALVSPREEPAPAELSVWRGRLSARGYRVEVSEAGLVPWLELETPNRMLFQGVEPKRRLTPRGALFLFAGGPVALALVLACFFPSLGLLPVLLLLGLAALMALLVSSRRRSSAEPLDRAIDFAWTMLVPWLHPGGSTGEDSAFAAGLALASAGRGDVQQREEVLKQLRQDMEAAVAAGTGPVRHLAALWRLTVEDLAEQGQDPLPLLVTQIGRCFDGTLPLSFAAQMFSQWSTSWWTESNLSRLRVLLCDSAFEAGLEVQDLLEIGRVAPPLGAALQTNDPKGLAHLRLLWSLRPTRPWDRVGKNTTVFELAADAEAAQARLARYPDLLLTFEDAPLIHLCIGGVVFQDQVFTQSPQSIEVVPRRLLMEAGFELILDDQRFVFPTDPEQAGRRLERLFRYYEQDFRPQVQAVHRWRSPVVSKTLRAQNAVPCPECRRPVLTRAGEVGIPMEVAADVEPPQRPTRKHVG